MGYTVQIGEIFEELNQAKSRKDKKDILEKNKYTPVLRYLLRGIFDPKVQYIIDDTPDYTPSDLPYGEAENTLFLEIPKCSIFVKGNPKANNIPVSKAKQILIQILETLHATEASLYMQMLKKKTKIKGLTSKLVLEVFPNMYKEGG